MAEHTPGPWEADGRYDVWANQMPGGWRAIICTLAEGRFAVHPSVALQREVMDANARLIAAAPDLLAALIQQCPCECRHGSITDDFGNEREIEDVCQRCAAIAKAGQTAPDSAPAP